VQPEKLATTLTAIDQALSGRVSTVFSSSLAIEELLPQVEPTLAEWAAFFAAGASKRAAAEAGLSRAATAHEADDLLRDAEIFLSVVETALGVDQAPLPLRPAG